MTAPFDTRKTTSLAIGPVAVFVLLSVSVRADDVSFNFEVRPILSAKCFACHGPDAAKRKAKLRLDDRAVALEKKAIIPGDAERSGLVEHIFSTDPKKVMPPPEKHMPLTDAEKATLRTWISAGAVYEPHWAFTTPKKPSVPTLANAQPMDALVLEALTKKGLKPSAPATREEWLRRVTLALTGLPPTLAEIDAFLADNSSDARKQVVDQLLKSPHYGERLAADWLDAARYGDTYGRHEDADSEVWPWRDWVIRAFNDNLPYDQFLTWQMAGDLLPNATQDQIVATAFHRLPVQSNESGSDPEEFRWAQVFDRVECMSTAALGLTMNCCRCHDHKFDPFTMKDYYGLAAFVDNIDELGLFSRYTNGIPPPTTFVYKDDERTRHLALKQAVSDAQKAWQSEREQARPRFDAWLKEHAPPTCGSTLFGTRRAAPMRTPEVYISFDYTVPAKLEYHIDSAPELELTGRFSRGESAQGRHGLACNFLSDKTKKFGIPQFGHYLRWQPFTFSFWFRTDAVQDRAVILHRSRAGLDAANRGYELTFEDGKLTATLGHFYPGNAIRVQATEKLEFKEWRHVGFSYDGSSRAAGLKLYVDGKPLPVQVVRDHLYKDIDYLTQWGDLDTFKVADARLDAIGLMIGGRTLDAGLRSAAIDELRSYDAELSAVEIGVLAEQSVNQDNAGEWFDWYAREVDGPARAALAKLTEARKEENDFTTGLTEMMVMHENEGPRRETHLLSRGDFRKRGDAVLPATPASLPPMLEGAPRNRLGLAQWLTDKSHPLTARVEVNRLWALFFGRGIVATQEDFGVQGRAPSNPRLLDWLAVHFMESGWDIKGLCREIALSDAFARSSIPVDPAQREADPDNALLARGPSLRLTAEQARDAALAACGLLNPAIGGRSVKPYQPAGLWEDSGTQHVYEQDHGDKLYRRSVYTFWRRTCPPPTMSVFDAPTREFCRVRRESTTTPLQSLALMNDTAFLEASRVLAERLVRALPKPDQQGQRVSEAFRLLTATAPTDVQSKAMSDLIAQAREHYQAHSNEAADLLAASGESPVDAKLPPVEVAATLLMTRAVLNSESFIVAR